MYKIAVIGDKDSVLGFKAVGFDVFPVVEVQEAAAQLHSLAKQDYAIIYIIQDFYRNMKADIGKYENVSLPAVISIPGKSGSDGSGMLLIKNAVERAIGADILYN